MDDRNDTTPRTPVPYFPKEEGLTTAEVIPGLGIGTHIQIDWNHQWQVRKRLSNTAMKPYLLQPEVSEVLKLIEAMQRPELHFLVNTLWHTGARISEALELRREHFYLEEMEYPYVEIPNTKRRKKKRTYRILPLADDAYLKEARLFLGGLGGRQSDRVFRLTRNAAWKALTGLKRHIRIQPLNPHAFRHSFAVNAVLHLIPIGILSSWMGHTNLNATSVYAAVFNIDTFQFMRWVKYA